MQKPFVVTSRVISHLGESLIKNESIALLELVKNSYDANAPHCWVDFDYKGGVLNRITVEDDGDGMTLDIVQTVWLVIGTDNKKKQLEKPISGRLPLGEKGIGRLSIATIGPSVLVVTRANRDDVVLL